MNTSETVHFFLSVYYSCAETKEAVYVFSAWFGLYIFLLPLFLLVLYIGFTKWWQQRNSSTVSMSHCDVLTLHMMLQEVILTVGAVLYMSALFSRHYWASASGTGLLLFTTAGQSCLHCLTCIERYVAVVHPITYLSLKRRGGVIIRNVSISVVWLVSVGYMLAVILPPNLVVPRTVHLLLVCTVTSAVSFCSLAVLSVLIRPGPGDNCQGIDKSKQSAFTTIIVILGVLMVRMVQLLVLTMATLITAKPCVLYMSMFWFSLPSSLVLPLLFLHRNGRLSACC